jgi:hypothetical protein
MWLGDMDESFVAAEPRPLCALSDHTSVDVTDARKRTGRRSANRRSFEASPKRYA